MSRENVEVVRRCFDAYQAGDIAASVTTLDPEVEFDMTYRPDGRVFNGYEGVAEGMRTWTGAFESWTFAIEEIVDAGDQVVVVTRERGRGKRSGIEIQQVVFHVARLRNAKIVHLTQHLDRGEALKAAGLSE
jgi:ketosteroid isomerase-like protein